MPIPKKLENIAKQFAPIFIADRYKTGSTDVCDSNIPTAVNFDGDWDPTNNEENYQALLSKDPGILSDPSKYQEKGVANIYYDAVETDSYVFLTYYLFYPHDAGDNCAFGIKKPGGGHENDASSVMEIVRKDSGTGTNSLEYVVTSDHDEVKEINVREVVTSGTHPEIKISNGNHTMQVVTTSNAVQLDGEVYYTFGKTDGYTLQQIFNSLWQEKDNKSLLCPIYGCGSIQYCEDKNKLEGRGTPPWAPWIRTFNPEVDNKALLAMKCHLLGFYTALSFSDPITAFKHLLQNWDSEKYLYNEYKTRGPK